MPCDITPSPGQWKPSGPSRPVLHTFLWQRACAHLKYYVESKHTILCQTREISSRVPGNSSANLQNWSDEPWGVLRGSTAAGRAGGLEGNLMILTHKTCDVCSLLKFEVSSKIVFVHVTCVTMVLVMTAWHHAASWLTRVTAFVCNRKSPGTFWSHFIFNFHMCYVLWKRDELRWRWAVNCLTFCFFLFRSLF